MHTYGKVYQVIYFICINVVYLCSLFLNAAYFMLITLQVLNKSVTITNPLITTGQNFPGGPVVKNLPCNAWDPDLIPGPERSHMMWSN